MAKSAAAMPQALFANSRRVIPRRLCFCSTISSQRRFASIARAVGGIGQNSPLLGG
jgi:hypothetical protein